MTLEETCQTIVDNAHEKVVRSGVTVTVDLGALRALFIQWHTEESLTATEIVDYADRLVGRVLNETTDVPAVLAFKVSYDAWKAEREELSEQESDGDYPAPGRWADNDDTGIDLLRTAVQLLDLDTTKEQTT